MKKSVIKFTATAIFSLVSCAALAQNAADRKPKIDEAATTNSQDKTVSTSPVPTLGSSPKALKAEQQAKPIVPGGEFRPLDPAVMSPANKTEITEKPPTVVIPKKVNKK